MGKISRVIEPSDYFNHEYNNTLKNERAIEVTLGFRFIQASKRVVEIGSVMPYYGFLDHDVVDPYDSHLNCIREDAEYFEFTDRAVLSISTIEHIGDKEFSELLNVKFDPYKSVRVLHKIKKEARSFLITFPGGYNAILNEELRRARLNFDIFAYERVQLTPPLWRYISDVEDSLFDIEYNVPFPAANIVFVLVKGI